MDKEKKWQLHGNSWCEAGHRAVTVELLSKLDKYGIWANT